MLDRNILASNSDNLGSLDSSYHVYTGPGGVQDVEHVISRKQRAMKYIPSGHGGHAGYLKNLGLLYLCLFLKADHLWDIDHAILYLQKAVESTPSGHDDLPDWLNSLGVSYLCRFKRNGDLQDIDHSISHLQRSVEFTPSDSIRKRPSSSGCL